jgi:hypothetical protein
MTGGVRDERIIRCYCEIAFVYALKVGESRTRAEFHIKSRLIL